MMCVQELWVHGWHDRLVVAGFWYDSLIRDVGRGSPVGATVGVVVEGQGLNISVVVGIG